jgi:hypothetical protein
MISSGVTGKYGDIEGVWTAPVTAQLITTFRLTLATPGPSPMGLWLPIC